ncbi:MAG TPA: DUF5916 domain-containing protein [Gemmatimonadales bacterium]|nr:DUF5916 domain-containing protein [Gemmatimonadales bacterium]
MSPVPPLLPLALLLAGGPGVDRYDGRARQLDVAIPRLEAEVVIDGVLNEAVWQRAARLTGFSRYAPTDDVPADDSTEVYVWYSPTAIHFGVRAYAEPGTVHATLADRDRMYTDDYIGIFLGTFNDGRQATVFAANPLGVQGDGIMVERGASTLGFSGLPVGRESPDINPDFVFQSKGRVTEAGYEIEIRIPFKSLRYASANPQSWGFNVLRKVQSRGYEYSWAPARRAAASYLAQVGRLTGLTDMRRGVVLDVTPVVTGRVAGARAPAGGYDYDAHDLQHPRFGANVRWGITTNLTLNGTVRPDFAEVESDAGQLVADPRQALLFPEKRPFFLEGSEQFAVPGNLIYTRRILSPLGAAKLTGKVAGLNVGYLGAVDDTSGSFDFGSHPIYNILRVQRDVGRSSRAGFLYTDKEDGAASNRVLGADARLVLGPRYSLQLQGAMSRTARPGVPVLTGPTWRASLLRSGRTFGTRYSITGLHPDFRSSSGLVSRPDVVDVVAIHSVNAYGKPGGPLERASFDVVLDGTWEYRDFVHGRGALEKKLHFNSNWQLRGGWHAGASVLFESFGFDPSFYAGYAIERHTGAAVDTIPFTGTPRIPNRDYVLSFDTPQFRHFSLSGQFVWGRDENFFEWASADIGLLTVGGQWRPTDRLRVDGSYSWQWYHRRTDGSTVGQGRIPRLKVEYQLSRSMFLRAVGQYTALFQDDLRDDSRTNDPLLVPGPGGVLVRALGSSDNVFDLEWLFSYLPTPGTVIYVGYGGTLREPEPFRFGRLGREHDSYFVKLSYLFRK